MAAVAFLASTGPAHAVGPEGCAYPPVATGVFGGVFLTDTGVAVGNPALRDGLPTVPMLNGSNICAYQATAEGGWVGHGNVEITYGQGTLGEGFCTYPSTPERLVNREGPFASSDSAPAIGPIRPGDCVTVLVSPSVLGVPRP